MSDVAEPNRPEHYRYPAIRVVQRPTVANAPQAILFAAPPSEIERWADISRLGHDGQGIQRRRNKAKVDAVTRFLRKDARNTIPNAITVALADVTWELDECDQSFVTIPTLTSGGKGLIIDGQHRLYGVKNFDPLMKLNIVAILDPDDVEIAFQFLVINNKASKVPTDHIKLLSVNFSDGELQTRLQSARMTYRAATLVNLVDQSDDSPFYHSLSWPIDERPEDDRTALVTPSAIELSLNYISSKNLPGLEESDDARLVFFFALWAPIKDAWADLWIEDSRLLSKVGVFAMTQFLVDDLTPLIDRGQLDAADKAAVSEEVGSVIANVAKDFWIDNWRLSSLDTSAGRQIVLESLQRVRRNGQRGMPWYEGVTLCGPPDSD
jgi:DGQHR domain-containing protein